MTYRSHWHCLLGRKISRTTADNMCIIRICSDNMQMTCTYADEMWTMSRFDMQRKPATQIILQIIYMILKWNNSTFLPQIPFNNKFLSQQKIVQAHGDHEEWCRWPADNVWMTCPGVDNIFTCADDTHMHRWHANNVRTMCRRCVDDVQTTRGQRARDARCSTAWNSATQASSA